MNTYLTQTYVIAYAGGTIDVIGEHLPLRMARKIADRTGHTCVIRHTGGLYYVHPA